MLTLNAGTKPMPWHDDPRCAGCRTVADAGAAAAAEFAAALRERPAGDMYASLSALLSPAEPAPGVVAEQIEAAWAEHDQVDLICPRCNRTHHRRQRAGHAPYTPGAAVVCATCRRELQTVTIASRTDDDLPTFDRPGPWIADGLCAQTDPEIFHPDKGGTTREAKAVCARCPVIDPCRDWAIRTGQRFGVWGGLSERERRTLAAEQRSEAAAS